MHYNAAKANAAEQKGQRKALRNNLALAEATLWRALKGRGAGGLKFRRQQGIGSYMLDFYCPEHQLCVELDGSSHDYRYEYDEARTRYLAEQGIGSYSYPLWIVACEYKGIIRMRLVQAFESDRLATAIHQEFATLFPGTTYTDQGWHDFDSFLLGSVPRKRNNTILQRQ